MQNKSCRRRLRLRRCSGRCWVYILNLRREGSKKEWLRLAVYYKVRPLEYARRSDLLVSELLIWMLLLKSVGGLSAKSETQIC